MRLRKRTPVGEIDVFAMRRGEKIAAEVKHGNKRRLVTSRDIEKIAKKAKAVKAKAVLVLSGKAEVTSKARKTAKNIGVRIKRLK